MKKIVAILLSILWVIVMQGQDNRATIYGQLQDAVTGEHLINATVKIIRVTDSSTVRQVISNKNGFLINRVPKGKFFLKPSYIGYRDTTYLITIEARDSIYNAGILMMKKSGGALMEVIVKSTIPPVITKSDTIVYNTSVFKTRPNATVDELLKKLPGMEVDKDGNVTFQGEKVQKIYIDGKEFFVNDTKLVTQNLLADMVQMVEAFDEKSERAKLTGIPDDKPGKAINLRLKPDKKKGYFGNVLSGITTPNRSNLNVSASYLKGDAMSIISAGSTNNGSGRINNRVKNISLNYRNSINQHLQYSLSYEGNTNNSRTWSFSQRQTFTADSFLMQEKEAASSATNKSHTINLGIQYKIDSISDLSIAGGFGLQKANNNTVDLANSSMEKVGHVQLINKALTNINKDENTLNGNIILNYNRRFRKKGRYLGLQFNSSNNKRSGDGEIASLTKFYNHSGLEVDSVERNQRFNQYVSDITLSLGISYTEPLGNSRVFDFYYNFSSSSSESNRQTYNYNANTGKYDEPDSSATNGFENSHGQHNFGIGYNNFRSDKLRYQIGLGLSKSWQQSINRTTNINSIGQTTINIFPRASLIYSINKQRSIRVAYGGRSRQPGIAELQPIPDFSNPLLIQMGNPSLKSEFNNEISSEYRDFNAKKMRSFALQINFRNTLNRIVNAITINAQGIQEQKYININSDYGVGGSVSYDIPLIKPQKPLNFRYNTSINLYRDANLINGELNIRYATSMGHRFTLNYHIGEKLFAAAMGNLNINSTKYSIQISEKNTFISHQYNGNISYELFWHLVMYIDFSMSFNNNQRNLRDQNTAIWNATMMKKMFKDKKGELKLSIFDIFNDKKDFTQIIGGNYMEVTTSEVVRRMINLSFVYRFRGNKL